MKQNDMTQEEVAQEDMIQDILKHLDSETQFGAMRMTVETQAGKEGSKEVSHKCCTAYGRPANETVGLLDMYTDISAPEKSDREE